MIQNFDIFNQAEKPPMILCNPDKTEIAMINQVCYNTKLTKRYNSISEIEFSFPKYVNDVELLEYDLLVGKRLVYLTGIDYFIITQADETIENDVPVKIIKGQSLEYEMLFKKLFIFKGTYKFYDPLDVERSMMSKIIQYLPTWSIGSIDSSLMTKGRTFDIKDSTIYNFLSGTASTTYGCVFTFDTINKTISADKIENVVQETDIYLSQENLVKSVDLKEVTDEIVTKLFVYGGGGLDVRTVNPLGENAIYNFDYFKTTKWMSQELIDAINAWENVVETQQPIYATKLTELKNLYAELLILQEGKRDENDVVLIPGLSDLKSDLKALEIVIKTYIQSGWNKVPDTEPSPNSADYNNLIREAGTLANDIQAKQGEITAKEAEITTKKAELVTINTLVSFETNFTTEQYNSLSLFMYENTWQNENIVQLDSDTPEQVQTLSQELYDQALEVIARVSQPRYEFAVDSVNFVFLKEYLTFTNQLQLGCKVHIQAEKYNFDVVLLEVSLNYDKPNDFNLVFGNRLRLDNEGFIYSDLFGNIVKTGTSVSFDSVGWSDWTNNYKTDVSTFIDSALNTTRNELINSTDQEIIIDGAGLRGRRFESGTYNDKQVWLTSNLLAFTDDSWSTVTTALGEITLPDGSKTFGLAGGAIFGTLLMGTSLNLTMNNGATEAKDKILFTVDERGMIMQNGKFQIENQTTRILINPSQGIRIVDLVKNKVKFFVDTDGNVKFSGTLEGADGDFTGKITAKEGLIGGWVINEKGLANATVSPTTYLYKDSVALANGRFKISQTNVITIGVTGKELTIDANGNATFKGNIYAKNLDDYKGTAENPGVGGSKLNPSIGIPSGSGSIGWGGGTGGGTGFLSVSGTGNALLKGSLGVEIMSGAHYSGGVIALNSTFAGIYGGSYVAILTPSLNLSQVSAIATGSGNGFTGTIASPTTLSFKNGILYGYT